MSKCVYEPSSFSVKGRVSSRLVHTWGSFLDGQRLSSLLPFLVCDITSPFFYEFSSGISRRARLRW